MTATAAWPLGARGDDAPAGASELLIYDQPKTFRLQCELSISAPAGVILQNVHATCPLPVEWPEQKVRLIAETLPRGARSQVTAIPHTGAVLNFYIPLLPPGQTATATRVYEITRYRVRLKGDVSSLDVPQKLPRDAAAAVKMTVEERRSGGRFRDLAREIAANEEAWDAARQFFRWIRTNVSYEEGEFRGAAETLAKKVGDCEDMTALFVALCRAAGIPARNVWIENHAYPEFYMADEHGNGAWIPVQVSGPEWFGEMAEYRPIVQKGDELRDPIRRRTVRYIPQSARAAGGAPRLVVSRTILPLEPPPDDAPAAVPAASR
ncbi:MAG: transglutaminase domain-containing protein [Planctomycetes bacterium]|nr:transglutaminase domain-containing protein [Planctomycetota bacterium]